MKKPTLIILSFSATIIWMAGIFYLSSIPGLATGSTYDTVLRKIAHITEYAILYLLLFANVTLVANQKTIARKHAMVALLLAFLYAVSDEYHQSFVETRNGSPFDVAIDSLGIGAGYLVARIRKVGEAYDRLGKR